jgi:(heptosyl)LPS beta-1,4-glucosyltransferase
LATIQAEAADVYWLPRKNLLFGQWIQHSGWWPDFQPRLFRRGSVSWQKGVHRLPDTQGKQVHFPVEEHYALVHYNYEDVTHFLEKLNNYTSIQAKERLVKTPKTDFSSHELLETFISEFSRRAMAMDGVRDGLHGISLSLLQAMYEVTIYLKQWGEQGFGPTRPENLGKSLQKMQQIWGYWWADYQVRHTRGVKKIYWQIRRKLKV